MVNDAECYARYLDGDDSGLGEIIDRYHNGISLFINSIVNDICAAEEIMQNTFVKLAVYKPKFNNRSSFKTWLYTIARNCAYDYLKHRSRFSDKPVDEYFSISDEIDIEKQYLKDETKIELCSVMKKLSSDYSQVLYLIYFEELDTFEAAKVMKKSKRQIGDLVYRAKKSLKSELEKAGFEYEGI